MKEMEAMELWGRWKSGTSGDSGRGKKTFSTLAKDAGVKEYELMKWFAMFEMRLDAELRESMYKAASVPFAALADMPDE